MRLAHACIGILSQPFFMKLSVNIFIWAKTGCAVIFRQANFHFLYNKELHHQQEINLNLLFVFTKEKGGGGDQG